MNAPQRSATNSMHNRWEVTGGGCDDKDESILHSVAGSCGRWPAKGRVFFSAKPTSALQLANHISSLRGPKSKYASSLSLVEVGDDAASKIRLDPKEHQRFVWATEAEVRANKVGDVRLELMPGFCLPLAFASRL
jgi:hypothetical protein